MDTVSEEIRTISGQPKAPRKAAAKKKKPAGKPKAKKVKARKAAAKSKAKRPKVVKTRRDRRKKLNIKPAAVERSERLDLRVTKADKDRVVAKAKRLRRTITSILTEAVEKIR